MCDLSALKIPDVFVAILAIFIAWWWDRTQRRKKAARALRDELSSSVQRSVTSLLKSNRQVTASLDANAWREFMDPIIDVPTSQFYLFRDSVLDFKPSTMALVSKVYSDLHYVVQRMADLNRTSREAISIVCGFEASHPNVTTLPPAILERVSALKKSHNTQQEWLNSVLERLSTSIPEAIELLSDEETTFRSG